MKGKLCFILFINFLLFRSSVFPQTGNKSSVNGMVVLGETKQPVESASVQVFRTIDSVLVAGTATDKKGAFAFHDLPSGNYYVQISFVGFERKKTKSFSIKQGSGLDLGLINITATNIPLGDVQVVYKRSVQDNSIDRKIYHAGRDILGQTGSASDILQNIPSVTVDIDGNVSLRGSGNVTFFINGRPSALLKKNSASVLQQIPASTIEQIEVITNPSAKYKPDGTVGIINIVLKIEKLEGFNGTILANAGNHGRYNSGLLLNYKSGKINITGNYGFRRNTSPRSSTDFRINRDSLLNIANFYENESHSSSRSYSHIGTLSAEFEIDDKNKIELSGNLNREKLNNILNSSSTWKTGNETITSQYKTLRSNAESDTEWETSAVFSHEFAKKDHELQFELNTSGYSEREDSHLTDTYSVPSGIENRNRILIRKGGPQTELYAEYKLPFGEESELETGYVGHFVKDNISYLGENLVAGQYVKDLNKSNDFRIQESIHALYATFSHSPDAFSFIAGLRAEQVFITSDLITLDSVVPNSYFRIYPTLHLAYKPGKDQQFQLNYSHRVRRPDTDEMNPFPEYSDPRNMESGNPRVKPEQIHSIEFGYQMKKENLTIQPTVYYRYRYDAFTQIQKYVNDTVLLTTFENLSRDQSTGLELIFSANPYKYLSLNLSTNAFHQTIDASNLGYSAHKSSFSFDSKLGINLDLTPSTLVQMYAYHRTAKITAQGRVNPVLYMNLGLKQELFKKRASMIMTVSDVFNSMTSKTLIDTPILYRKRSTQRASQIVYFGFSYHFGKVSKKTDDLKFDDNI